MKINPNDPWYPNPFKKHDVYDEGVPCVVCDKCPHGVPGGCPACLGVPIRLKLAAEMMKSPQLLAECLRQKPPMDVVDCAFYLADAMIEEANRDERSINGK